MSLFRKPIFHFPCFQGLLTVVFRSSYTLYIGLLLYYILVCLSKVFQRTIFLSSSRFSGKAFAKVRRFFVTSKFFRKFFLKKFSEGSQKACGLSFLAPLHIRKVRYSVQRSALSPVASALPVCHLQRLSLSKAVAKVQTFSVSATFTPYFFSIFFHVLV